MKCFEHKGTILARSTFTNDQQKTGSTARELDAVIAALFAVKNDIQNKCIRLYTDNTGVVQIIEKGFASNE